MYRSLPTKEPKIRRLAPFNQGAKMRSIISKTETMLLAACLVLLAVALAGPVLPQPGHYHDFADQRVLWGLPFAMDVLSNIPFALAGVAGMVALLRLPPLALDTVPRAMAWLFFAGLVVTAGASSWYHWRPDEAGLAIDRCGMAVAFAGLLGLAAAGRVSDRAGAALALAVLVLAPLAAQVAAHPGNVLPWAALQSGGIALMLWFAVLRSRRGALAFNCGLVILAYAVAKLLELNDHQVYALTGQFVSGHTLKHVAAAFAAGPVIAALWPLGGSGQNAAGATSTSGTPDRRAGHA
jgi:hypothetical protein